MTEPIHNHQPIRCFEGNAQPHEPFWKFRNTAEGEEPEMELYGHISEYSWWEDDITPQMFKNDLYSKGNGGPITIRINSYGGDVIAASLMNAIIRDYPGKVTMQIDGVAASAATVVAMAGDLVRIQPTGFFMIHDPSVIFFLAQLNIEDLTRMADSLQAVKEGIINSYEQRTGLSRSRLSKLMTDETWMDAQRSIDLGFVDEMVQIGKKSTIEIPANTAIVNVLNSYRNVPPEVLAAFNSVNVPAGAESSEPLLTEDMQREAQRLREHVQTILQKEKKQDA